MLETIFLTCKEEGLLVQHANPELTKGRWTCLTGAMRNARKLKELDGENICKKRYTPVCGASANVSENRDSVEIRTEDETT